MDEKAELKIIANKANALGQQKAALVPHSAFAAGDLRCYAIKGQNNESE
ncbi:hypothetical protein QUF90_09015 [Desulfococcaceae bacterium HSG9]|nr:hypothetical protein [Desulfococcaceae bacterium HSG9]